MDGFPARLRTWGQLIGIDETNAQDLAGAMDVLTHAVNERPDDVHTLWINEVMRRRQYLCERLPAEHEYRGGEYCD